MKDSNPKSSFRIESQAERLEDIVRTLCEHHTPRSVFHTDALAEAGETVAMFLRRAGCTPVAQPFRFAGGRSPEYRNWVTRIPARGPASPLVSPWIIGAHYDAVTQTPGADDNASGIAVLVELARLLTLHPGPVPIELVAYANEEAPNFGTEGMGSMVHAKAILASGERIRGMLSLEMLGTYLQEPGTQRYPISAMHWIYPSKGNFVTFVSDFRNALLTHRLYRSFRRHSDFPCEMFCGPRSVRGLLNSDHSSYIRLALPAAMVTDTAYYRNLHYHTPEDTPEKLDYVSMARVTDGLFRILTAPDA